MTGSPFYCYEYHFNKEGSRYLAKYVDNTAIIPYDGIITVDLNYHVANKSDIKVSRFDRILDDPAC